jgi:hypothetical protein
VGRSIRGAATWADLDSEARTISRVGLDFGGCHLGLDQMVEAGVNARVRQAQDEGRGERLVGGPFSLIFETGLRGLPLALWTDVAVYPAPAPGCTQ